MKSNENNGQWKTSVAEFRGYVKAKLEEIHSDISEMKTEIESNRERLINLDKRTIVLALIVSGLVAGGKDIVLRAVGV